MLCDTLLKPRKVTHFSASWQQKTALLTNKYRLRVKALTEGDRRGFEYDYKGVLRYADIVIYGVYI